ncbi:M23 family metallopeptidase [Roseisolibacter agri]|uniref:M23ase beta-sheet core domain-containing protein n=1 Tax=Roseisolibacter agri TaxID=2014610 RepID=A0AA37Q529_9BACT|nr:M23 family metallopeptidase [Roseisolibacter agri]GLC24772.1 hypothetical protein rosag_12850 [Roseisolibacter agri]
MLDARRSGRALTSVLGLLVALAALVVLVVVVGTRSGWIEVERGSGVVASAAGEVGAATHADSLNAGAPVTPPLGAPAMVPAPGTSGDSVGLPSVDPALRGMDSTVTTSGGSAPLDSTSGLGLPPGASAASAPPPAATASDLATLRGRMIVPVRGVAASALHDDFDQARGEGTRRHEALDILAPRGTPVVAATDGKVIKLFNSVAGGLTLYQSDAANRFVLLYGHLDRYEAGLREGAPLKQGQVIGYVGSTGNASAETPHLHFAVARSADPGRWWGSGTPVNPYPLLKP